MAQSVAARTRSAVVAMAPSPQAGGLRSPRSVRALFVRPRLATSTSRPLQVAELMGTQAAAAAGRFVVLATDEVDVEEMTRMDKAVNSVKMNFSTIRTGRATPNMLDRIEVEYYGAMTPIKSVAGISTPDASTLSIQPFDQSAMAAIERAIMTSDLDLTPNNDGKVIRIRIPALTEERRKEMTKKTNALGEEGKVAVRNVRRDALKALGKLDSASEDIIKGMEAEIQKLTDESIKKIEQLTAAKNKDLTTL